MRAGSPERVRIAVVGLGPEGERLARTAVAALRAGWGRGPRPEVAVVVTGDDRRALDRAVRRWADREGLEAVLTVGRAGHESGDFAPEATGRLLDRVLPGVEERMHLAPARSPADLLFRGRAGMRRATLLANLPERPARIRAVASFLAPVLVHAAEKARGDDRPCARAPRRR